MTDITLRATKGAPLTYDELDANFANLKETADLAYDAVAGVGGKANASALGTDADATDLGSFTGDNVPDGSTAKEAIQALSDALDTTSGDAATKTNATAIGIAATDADMGTTPGNILSENGTAKDWFQESEAAIEDAEREVNDRSLSLLSYGGLGDGASDNATAFAAVIAAFGAFGSGTSQDGGTIKIGPGVFIVNASIDLTGKHGVVFEGAGPIATEIRASGDFPVFKIDGSSSNVTNKVGFRNMTIRGGGNGNGSAHGIQAKWTNRCFAENIIFFGCRNALDIYHAWQFRLDNLSTHGAGGDRCYNGVYQGETDLTYIDNAVIADSLYMQDCINAGFRIINGQGSKYTSCEAGACAYGWYVGDPTTGTVKSQWLHFTNCIGDSCTVKNWYFKKGAATDLGQMVIEGTWTGNCATTGFEIDGGTDMVVNGVIAISHDEEAIKLISCSRIELSGVLTREHNEDNGGYGAVKLQDSSDCVVTGVKSYSSNPDISVIETGTADNNILTGLSNLPTIVGASTKFMNVNNEVGFEIRNGANSVGAIIPGASGSAYLGLGTTADRLLHYIERNSSGRVTVGTNGSGRFFVGSGVGASEFLVGSTMPIKPQVGTVATVTSVSPPQGSQAVVTDANATTFNSVVAGGGANVVPVFFDGTNWRIG